MLSRYSVNSKFSLFEVFWKWEFRVSRETIRKSTRIFEVIEHYADDSCTGCTPRVLRGLLGPVARQLAPPPLKGNVLFRVTPLYRVVRQNASVSSRTWRIFPRRRLDVPDGGIDERCIWHAASEWFTKTGQYVVNENKAKGFAKQLSVLVSDFRQRGRGINKVVEIVDLRLILLRMTIFLSYFLALLTIKLKYFRSRKQLCNIKIFIYYPRPIILGHEWKY